jgi:hypothetical protein
MSWMAPLDAGFDFSICGFGQASGGSTFYGLPSRISHPRGEGGVGRAAFLFPVGSVVILAGLKGCPRVSGNASIAGDAGPFSPVSLTESVPPDHSDFVVGCCSVVVG